MTTARFTTADLAGAYGLGVLVGVIGLGLLIAAWLEVTRYVGRRIDDATRLPQRPEPPTERIPSNVHDLRRGSLIDRKL